MYLFSIIYLLLIFVFAIPSFKLLAYEDAFCCTPTSKSDPENAIRNGLRDPKNLANISYERVTNVGSTS